MFYTYAHYTPEGRLFYIGKGQGNRAHKQYSRNKYWHQIVQKHGSPKVQILANWDTEDEAINHEILLISCFRDLGYKLCNMTDGGEGTSGTTLSDEHKAKISLKLKGSIGKKPSEATLQKLRLSHLGQKAWNKGLKGAVKQTPQTIAKRVEKLLGHKFNNVYRYIGTNKSTLETIICVGDQEMIKNGFCPTHVRKCANGERKTHKNYTWVKELIKDAKC